MAFPVAVRSLQKRSRPADDLLDPERIDADDQRLAVDADVVVGAGARLVHDALQERLEVRPLDRELDDAVRERVRLARSATV